MSRAPEGIHQLADGSVEEQLDPFEITEEHLAPVERARTLKCDRCGRFTATLTPIWCNPPSGGIDREVCARCAALDGGDQVTREAVTELVQSYGEAVQ